MTNPTSRVQKVPSAQLVADKLTHVVPQIKEEEAVMRSTFCTMVVIVALGVACNTTQNPASCVQGWWVSQTNTCSTCDGNHSNPECAYADCEQFASQGFLVSGAVFDVVVTYSKTAGTISTVGPGVWRQFSVSDGRMQLSGSSGGSLIVHHGSQLKGSYSYQTPASSNIASSLSVGTTNKAVSFRGVRTGS